MQKSTVCALGDAAVKTMDRGLISRAGSMVHVGNYVKITMPSDVSKIFTVHTNSCILYILALLCIVP